MALTDMEILQRYAQESTPDGMRRHRRTLESWIAAGVLTPKETHEAGRILKLLRQRGRAGLPNK